MMKVEVLSGPPGCGKSHLMREEAIANPGRYIFFYPTAKLIAEQEAEFRKIPGLDVQIAYAKSRRSGSVQDQLNADAERARIAGIIHTIELTTHESLMGCDLSPFQDWHFRIDEAPNAVQSGKIGTTINRQFFQTRYDLDPLGTDGWSEVRPRGSADRFTDIARDDGASRRASQSQVHPTERVSVPSLQKVGSRSASEWSRLCGQASPRLRSAISPRATLGRAASGSGLRGGYSS